MLVDGHDVLDGVVHAFLLGPQGELLGEGGGLHAGLLNGLDKGARAGDGGVEFALADGFLGVAHGGEEVLQVLVLGGGQMAVGIHGEDQEVAKGLLLGGGKIREISFHAQEDSTDGGR